MAGRVVAVLPFPAAPPSRPAFRKGNSMVQIHNKDAALYLILAKEPGKPSLPLLGKLKSDEDCFVTQLLSRVRLQFHSHLEATKGYAKAIPVWFRNSSPGGQRAGLIRQQLAKSTQVEKAIRLLEDTHRAGEILMWKSVFGRTFGLRDADQFRNWIVWNHGLLQQLDHIAKAEVLLEDAYEPRKTFDRIVKMRVSLRSIVFRGEKRFVVPAWLPLEQVIAVNSPLFLFPRTKPRSTFQKWLALSPNPALQNDGPVPPALQSKIHEHRAKHARELVAKTWELARGFGCVPAVEPKTITTPSEAQDALDCVLTSIDSKPVEPRRHLTTVFEEEQKGENRPLRAETSNSPSTKVPQNPDVRDLCDELAKRWKDIQDRRVSRLDVAREFLRNSAFPEAEVDKKAKSYLRQCRAFRHRYDPACRAES